MPINPGVPSLTDYVEFLRTVVGLPPAKAPGVFPLLNGVANGGSTSSLIDTSQSWEDSQWLGYSLMDVTQNVVASISANNATTLIFSQLLSDPILATDQYRIIPGICATSLAVALEIVNPDIGLLSPTIYTLAVYNLAADRLINFAPDVPTQGYFTKLRADFRLMEVSVGPPSATSDAGTAVGILNPEHMKLFTMQDLQMLKTPYGRQYMAFAQMAGNTLYGIS